MAAVERNLEGDRDLLCVAPVASCNDILRAASGFCDGPHEALERGSPCDEEAFERSLSLTAGLSLSLALLSTIARQSSGTSVGPREGA